MPPHTVHLIDASPYVFRAWFALPATLVDRDGQPAAAVYGFTTFLLAYLRDEAPTHVGVAFDESLTTSFRNDFYPDYKAQRDLPPRELEAQLDDCRAVAEALGLASFVSERYEADDLIATLCEKLVRKGHRVVVISSDKDLSQLVRDGVTLFDYARGKRYGPREVAEKFGVDPPRLPDYQGLAGDAVDNIPGVRGVGPKTAAALLAHFEDLDELYERLDEVPALPLRGAARLAERLAEGREDAFLSRRLARAATDAPARADLRRLRVRGADRRRVSELFERLGFDGLRKRIIAPEPDQRGSRSNLRSPKTPR